MLQTIMSALNIKKNFASDGSDGFISRRTHPRRSCDQCIGFIDGKAHPILDWSPGGVKVFGDPRPLGLGQEMDVEMKFHLRDQLVHVKHRAKVVRKTNESYSLQFEPLTGEIRKTFQNVIDDFNAREFAGSQA